MEETTKVAIEAYEMGIQELDDFGFGMDCNGVIEDERTTKYKQ